MHFYSQTDARRRVDLLEGTALRTLAIGGLMLAASAPAYAQEAPAGEEQSPQEAAQSTEAEPAEVAQADQAAPEASDIVVTGSRIKRPNLNSPIPVASVSGEEFFQTGNVSVGDKLAELPQIASTFTQANSTRFLGTEAQTKTLYPRWTP